MFIEICSSLFSNQHTDAEAPTIQCPANKIVPSPDGDPVTPVYTDGPTYHDNSGMANMYCNPHLKTAFNIGSYTVTCTAIDRSENMDSCSFGIRVFSVGEEHIGRARLFLFNLFEHAVLKMMVK